MIEPEDIYRQCYESRQERAEFLWRLYLSRHAEGQPISADTYLDIGVGNLANATLFGRRTAARDAVGIDVRDDLSSSRDIAVVRADVRALPFCDRSFGLITMFSLMEHVPQPSTYLVEVLRVLRKEGELFIQLPNRYFPIELHSGLFMHFYLPKQVRNWLANGAGRSWMKDIEIPRPSEVRRILKRLDPSRDVVTFGFLYPASLLPKSRIIRELYRFLKGLNIFRLLPMGHCILVRACRNNS